MTLNDLSRRMDSRICSGSEYHSGPSAAANLSAWLVRMWARRSTSPVARIIPRTPDATDPPIKYGIRKRSRASASELSDFASGSIIQGIAVNFAEQFIAKFDPRGAEKDLMFIRTRMALPQTRQVKLADHFRPFKNPLYLLRRCQLAQQT